jgi:hypothetical protein
VRSGQIAQIEEEIDAEIGERNRGQAVFNLWSALATETVWRPIGGLRSLQEAPLLLAFMCELAEQGWPVPEGVPQSRTQASEAIVRMLRDGKTASGASCGRGLDKQSNSQSANFMRVLSSILAQHAQAAWGEAFDKNADDAFPLATGIPGRVGKLRAAGNAIVPQVAAEFIRACA